MKRILFIILFLAFGLASLFAQPIEVILSNDKLYESEPLKRADGEVIFSLVDTVDLCHARVAVAFNNLGQTDLWVFLHKELSNKELRKSHVFIDKSLKNSNTKIEASWHDLDEDVFIWPQHDAVVLTVDLERGKEKSLDIPFYIAKKKKTFLNLCNKSILLMEKITLSLAITVEEVRDNEFPILQDSLNSLIKDYKDAVSRHEFCTKTNHKHPPLIERKSKYVQRWYYIKSQIESSQSKWPRASKQFNQYNKLIDTIEAYSLDSAFLYQIIEDDCGMFVDQQRCAYCSSSLDILRKKIDSYFAKYSKINTIENEDWIEIEKVYKCSIHHNRAKRDKTVDAKKIRRIIKKDYDELLKKHKQQ